MGQQNILKNYSCDAKELMEKAKKNSTKMDNGSSPPLSSYEKYKGMGVPMAKRSPGGHDEYVVYSTTQARIRYVLRMNMNGGG